MCMHYSLIRRLASYKVCFCFIVLSVTARVHNKGKQREYPLDLIPYSFAPLILFLVPYMLDLLPYYLSIANGAEGVGIFELFVFQCFV